MRRLKHIDIAKGLGIILVVWGHSLIEFGHYIIYMFHMPLFFYLSGIFHRPGKYNELVTKKYKGLIIPLLIFIIVLFPMSYFSSESILRTMPPHLNGVFGPLWFLISLFFLSVIYHPMQNIRSVPRLLICLAMSFLLGFIPSVMRLENYAYCFTTFSALTFYAAGNVIGDRFVPDGGWRYQAMLFVIFAFALIAMYIVCYKYLHYGCTDMYENVLPPDFMLFVLSAVAGTGMVMSFSALISGDSIPAKVIAFIGECSMYIFAFHMAIMIIARKYLPFDGMMTEIFLIIISLTFGCCVRPVFKRLSPSVFK